MKANSNSIITKSLERMNRLKLKRFPFNESKPQLLQLSTSISNEQLTNTDIGVVLAMPYHRRKKIYYKIIIDCHCYRIIEERRKRRRNWSRWKPYHTPTANCNSKTLDGFSDNLSNNGWHWNFTIYKNCRNRVSMAMTTAVKTNFNSERY